MVFDFNQQRWNKLLRNADLWWAGKLADPLIQVRLSGYNSDQVEPDLAHHDFASFYDISVPAIEIIKRCHYDLCKVRFLGDAFPHFWPNFGPGIVAAFLGAELKNGKDTVWYSSDVQHEKIHNLHLSYSPDCKWYKRIREIIFAASTFWKGKVQVGFPDLGGTLDILASFRGPEQLIIDIYDNPDEVKRLTWEIHDAWWQYYSDFETILGSFNPGVTSWEGILSSKRHSIVQCDFAYMLSPDLFAEFVKPELEASAKKLRSCFYHLDGIGQLVHLDSILQIPEIQGIQWVPGAGQPDTANWPDVYRKIHAAGKLIQLFNFQCDCDFEMLDILKNQIGDLRGVIYVVNGTKDQESQARALLDKHS